MLLRWAAAFVLFMGGAPAWSACQPPGSSGFPAGSTRLDTQTKDSVSLTGGCIDGIPIGQNAPAAGNFTNLTVNGSAIGISGSLTLGGALTTTGAGPTTFAFPSSTATFTFPGSSATLMDNVAGNSSLPLARTNLGASVTGGIWPGALGGTGVANAGITQTLGGNVSTTGALTTGGALITGGALTTTGAGPTTLAFPGSTATFTYPATSKTLLANDVSNRTMPDAQINIGLGVTFNAYGAVGDGATDDQPALQTAVTAAAGGIIYGEKGKTYNLGAQVYVPSNTVIDCNGATLQYPPALGAFRNTLLWIGDFNGSPGTNVEIRNCRFESAATLGYSAIMFQPGSSRVKIHHNHFINTAGYTMRAIAIRASRVQDIQVTDNTFTDIQFGVYVDADETQAWKNCINILSSSTSQTCTNLTAVPAASTGTFDLDTISAGIPAGHATTGIKADIAAGMGWGVLVNNRVNGVDTFRLYGPYDSGTDFTYDSGTGVVTFASDLTTAAGTEVALFTWNPEIQPANDLQDLVVSGNVGTRFRGTAVQVNCTVRAYHRRMRNNDCIRNVVVDGNKFGGTYQLEGTTNSFAIAGGLTNFMLWGQDFANAVWTKTRASIASGTTKLFYSPPYDYLPTAQRIVEDSSSNTHLLYQAFSAAATGSHTFSCSFRASERTRVRLDLQTAALNGVTASFNLATGAVTASGNVGTGTGVAAGITYQGDGPPGGNGAGGWYRVHVSGTLDSTSLLPAIILLDASGTASYAGNGTSGLYAWGCQVTSGTNPYVYMPTMGVAANSAIGQLISINGVDNFTVSNNVLGPATQQCIHLEDAASHGTISGNTCRDAGGVAYYQADGNSIVWKGNSAFNVGGCLLVDSLNPTYAYFLGSETVTQSSDTTIEGNKCDLNNNPNAEFGYWITHGSGMLKLKLSDNTAINAPAGILGYVFGKNGVASINGGFQFDGEPAENLLINPSFDIDQPAEGGNYTTTGSAAVMDGWRTIITTAATGVTFAKASASPPTGGTNYGLLTIGTGNATVNAGDLIAVRQIITGNRIAGTKFGTADALPLALSWKEKCSIAVTKGVSLQNAALNRSYVYMYTLPADTWQDRYIVIPGDTAGTWSLTGATAGLVVTFAAEVGTSGQSSAVLQKWGAGNLYATSGQTQISQTTGATCRITDVNLQLAPVPTNIKRRSAPDELQRAQAFFEKTFPQGTALAASAGAAGSLCDLARVAASRPAVEWQYKVTKNAAPGVFTLNPGAAGTGWRNYTAGASIVATVDPSTAKSTRSVQIIGDTTMATIADNSCIHAYADARL